MTTPLRLLAAACAVVAATSSVAVAAPAAAREPRPWNIEPITFAPRIEWVTDSPWTEDYRTPLAELRAGVPADAPKYGPGRWTAVVVPEPVIPDEPDEPFIPDPPEPDEPSEPIFNWFTSPDADMALIYRVPTNSSPALGAYDFKYDNQSEYAVAFKADGSYDAEWIEVSWYRADAIVTYDPEKDFSTGPKVDHAARVSNLRVCYTFFPDEPDIDELKGVFVSVGGGWMTEQVLSNAPAGFEKPDFNGGLQMYAGFGFMLPLGGPVLELRIAFDMVMITENIFHFWFGASIWI